MFKEAGPLVMDPAVATQVSHFSQQNPVIFANVILDTIKFSTLSLPKQTPVVLRIQPHQIQVVKKRAG